MASIRIRVGAVLDPGATRVFDPLVAAAQRARNQIAGAGRAGAEEFVGGYRTAPARAKASFDAVAKAADKSAKDQARSAEYVYQIKKRYLEKEERDEERAHTKRVQRARGVISSAGRSFGGVVRSGLGLAGDVARGAGVDFSVGSLTSRNVATQKTATDITNSAYVEGASGSVGVRKDPKAVIAAAKEAANAAAISEEVALAGLQKFVGKSTDLQTGLDILTKMAVQSKATGSNLEDVLDAAGDIAVKLEDTPDKGKILAGVMATVAKQGQLGASELRTMAPYIGRIVSSSNQFASGTEKAVQQLGAAFQITKKLQGQTPASAATSVSRFVQDLTSKSGLKALHGSGVKDSDIFADKGKTKLKDLSEIIPTLLEKTGGDLTKLAKQLPNVKSGSVLKAFATIFSEGEKSGGKGGGRKAVQGTFSEYGGAMSEKQIQESLARAMETTESKAQLFQNRLQAIADDNLPRVIASLEKLAPVAAQAAEGFAKFVAWAAENPGTALAAALTASVAKAALGSVLEAGLTKALGSAGGMMFGSAIVTIAAATIIYKAVQAEKKAGSESVFEDVGAAAKDVAAARAEKKKGGVSDETRERLERERKTLVDDLALGARGDLTSTRLQSLNPFSKTTFGDVGRQEGAQDQGFRGDAAARIKEIDAVLGKGADGHVKAANALTKAAASLEKAAGAFAPVGGFGPGATTGPAPIR